jgi:hypothetical protein
MKTTLWMAIILSQTVSSTSLTVSCFRMDLNSLEDRIVANNDLDSIQSPDDRNRLSDPVADPVTVVGPTNDAFALLDTADLEFLTSPEGLADLTVL